MVPKDALVGGYYYQAISKDAPHPAAARLWEEFLYSDQGQIIWLKGGAHPARFADLVARKVIPAAVLAKLPASAIYNKVKFASIGQQTAAKNLIAQKWPTQVGG
jgi:putative spermidine/putrescine transport system substrate-binding protein